MMMVMMIMMMLLLAEDALVVSCGYQTVHIAPVLGGRLHGNHVRRINLGGCHLDNFMQRLLQLKYPAHLHSITACRAEVCYKVKVKDFFISTG